MDKYYIPIETNHHAKVIPISCAIPVSKSTDEWIGPEEAAKLFRSGKGITVRSLMNLVYDFKIPSGACIHSITGWRFHKPTLLGLKSIILLNPAA